MHTVARLGGRSAGTFGVAGTFSFYPTKVITAGEGGMIVTADDRLREEAVVYRDQGKAGFLGGEHIRLGYAWRMSEVHAAIASVHLRRLEEFIATRASVAKRYDAALLELDRITPVLVPDQAVSNYYKYVALLDRDTDRDAIKAGLRELGRVTDRRGLCDPAASRTGIRTSRHGFASGRRGCLCPPDLSTHPLRHD